MLFDVLSGLDTVKICTAYELDGTQVATPPSTISRLSRCRPVYIEMPGWKEDITGARSLADLPKAAVDYIRKIEELTGIPVGIVSVGPDRTQTILLNEKLRNF